MDKQEMIDKIYEVIADQTPSFGCFYKTKVGDKHQLLYREYNLNKNRDELFLFSKVRGKYCLPTNDCDIIGHPVMIGDVLDWMETNLDDYCVYWSQYTRGVSGQLIEYRKEKRKPIGDQPIKCIEYVYNLLG